MSLNEMIYKRLSVRKYTSEILSDAAVYKIKSFLDGAKRLYPDIKIRMDIIGKENVRCLLPWIPNQAAVFYSEEKEGYLENAGFIFQQLDLYLQEQGFGTCWLGLGRLNSGTKGQIEDGMKFVIMLGVGYPQEEFRKDVSQFNRNKLAEISDWEDERLEPARLAPSSCNSQPWYFKHDGDILHAYCSKQGFLRNKFLGEMNQIDMGIALAHMYVANPEGFQFYKLENAPEVEAHDYVGSIKIDV